MLHSRRQMGTRELMWNEADFDVEHWEVEGFLEKGTFEQDVETPTLSFKNGWIPPKYLCVKIGLGKQGRG